MSIVIDCRERDLIEMIKIILENNNPELLIIEQLNLGDIIIDDIIIERKTLNDLASSIIDGRYKEQGIRLQEAQKEGKKIYYFIEGNINNYKSNRIKKETLISCIFTITYEKGMQVITTNNLRETAIFILQFRKKIGCNKTIEKSILKKKNSNITKDNISEFMLCQIPSISKVNSDIILNKYGNINNLICELNKDEHLLENFKYIKDNKEKKIKKNIIENINYYLRI